MLGKKNYKFEKRQGEGGKKLILFISMWGFSLGKLSTWSIIQKILLKINFKMFLWMKNE
jgi:hypothetical protein